MSKNYLSFFSSGLKLNNLWQGFPTWGTFPSTGTPIFSNQWVTFIFFIYGDRSGKRLATPDLRHLQQPSNTFLLSIPICTYWISGWRENPFSRNRRRKRRPPLTEKWKKTKESFKICIAMILLRSCFHSVTKLPCPTDCILLTRLFFVWMIAKSKHIY